jgi:hypothetical protein
MSSALFTSCNFYAASPSLQEKTCGEMEDKNTTKAMQDLRVFSNMSGLRRFLKLQAENLENETINHQYIGLFRIDNNAWNGIKNA